MVHGTMGACSEVRTLRLLVPGHVRDRAIEHLVRKYAAGRRCVSDVVSGLDACLGQNRCVEAASLWVHAARAVHPVPLVLADWCCAHLDIMSVEALRLLLRLAADDVAVSTRVGRYVDALTATPEGLVALMYDGSALRWWSADKVKPAVQRYLTL